MAQAAHAAPRVPTSAIDERIDGALQHLRNPKVQAGVVLGSHARRAMSEFLHGRDFVEIPPVIVAPVTDPLNHPVSDPRVDYYGHDFQLTRSMIFHKQLATLAFEKVFCFSPNLRFEPLDRSGTGRHLVEFTQMDLEVRDAGRDDIMRLVEEMLTSVVSTVRSRAAPILQELGRTLPPISSRLRRVRYEDAQKEFGPSFELELSRRAKEPFWIIDIPLLEREFYDREDPKHPGFLLDMDLIYPEGYGEAISGGEREHELGRILERIHAKGQTPDEFRWYVEAARQGLPPSCGFGIGIERLSRWLGGLRTVEETTLFPKRIGAWSL
ncbi:MAG: asparagine synthetase [Euryarchaeota archaeon]|nr:asparagine synthetase [Euryarchaeota archaeon]